MLGQRNDSAHNSDLGWLLHGPNVHMHEPDVVAGHGRKRPAIPRWGPRFQARLAGVACVLSDVSDVHDRDQLVDGMADGEQFHDESPQQEVDVD